MEIHEYDNMYKQIVELINSNQGQEIYNALRLEIGKVLFENKQQRIVKKIAIDLELVFCQFENVLI